MPDFRCDLCLEELQTQYAFFEHLKLHYGQGTTLIENYKDSVCQVIEDVIQEVPIFKSELLQLQPSIVTALPVETDGNAEFMLLDAVATNEIIKQVELIRCGHGCPVCSIKFTSKVKLEAHVRQLHPDEIRRRRLSIRKKIELKCIECSRVFNHRNSLIYHMRSHTGERPHICDVCGKKFFATSALKVHLRLHSGDKPYKCDNCGRHFRQWGDLKYHMISIHSDIRNYQCEFCGKDFARKYSLVVHRRIHTGERNYTCEFCQKCFRAASYLQNHRKIHTGEKPHACDVCGKPFRVRSDMKRHMGSHNRENRQSNQRQPTTDTAKNLHIPDSQVPEMGPHHIALKDGETLQASVINEIQINLSRNEPQSIASTEETECILSDVTETDTTQISGTVEDVTITDSNLGQIYVWPLFLN